LFKFKKVTITAFLSGRSLTAEMAEEETPALLVLTDGLILGLAARADDNGLAKVINVTTVIKIKKRKKKNFFMMLEYGIFEILSKNHFSI
jgi:hypothetical protein